MNEWKVQENGVVVSFVKYLDGFDPLKEKPPSVADMSSLSLYCLHNYDEVTVRLDCQTIDDAVAEMRRPTRQEWAVARRLICFRIQGECNCSDQVFLSQSNRCIYLILLRLNPHLTDSTTLQMESAVVRFIRQHAVPHSRWLALHTLAKKELLLVYSGDFLSCEEIVHTLEAARAISTNTAPAFAAVGVWPCFRLDQEDSETLFECDTTADKNVNMAGLMVTGVCARARDDGSVCAGKLNDCLSAAIQTGGAKGRKILRGGSDCQIGWEFRPGLNILKCVRDLRDRCAEKTCSIGVVRAVSVLSRDSVFKNGEVQVEKPCTHQQVPITELANRRAEHGFALIADHLDRLRSDLLRNLANLRTIEEFRDITRFVDRVNTMYTQFEEAIQGRGLLEENRRRYGEENVEDLRRYTWGMLRSSARTLARYFERAMGERSREDLLAHPTQATPSLFGASGFSRIAPVARYTMNELYHSVAKNEDTYIVVIGPHADSRQDRIFRVANAPLRASLEPYFYHGLSHEVGHALFQDPSFEMLRQIVATANTLNDNGASSLEKKAGRKLEKCTVAWLPGGDLRGDLELCDECFADVFCLLFGFECCLPDYLDAWLAHFVTVLRHTRYVETIEFFGGRALPDKSVHQKSLEYCWRLVNVTAYAAYEHGQLKGVGKRGDVGKTFLEASKHVRDKILSLSTEAEWAKHELFCAINEICEVLRALVESGDTQEERVVLACATFRLTGHLISQLTGITAVPTDDGYSKEIHDRFVDGVVVDECVSNYHSALRHLCGEKRFKVNLAAILTAGHSEELLALV